MTQNILLFINLFCSFFTTFLARKLVRCMHQSCLVWSAWPVHPVWSALSVWFVWSVWSVSSVWSGLSVLSCQFYLCVSILCSLIYACVFTACVNRVCWQRMSWQPVCWQLVYLQRVCRLEWILHFGFNHHRSPHLAVWIQNIIELLWCQIHRTMDVAIISS